MLWRILKPFVGIIICAGNGLSISLSFCIVKFMHQIGPFTAAASRSLIMALLALVIVVFRKQSLVPKGFRVLLFLRSIMGTTHLCIYFFALKHMPMADAAMITAAAPLFACIFARIFLKDPIEKIHLLNIVFVLTGILLIVRPPFIFGENEKFSNDPLYVYAVLGVCFIAVLIRPNVFVILHQLKSLEFEVVLADYGITEFLVSACMLFVVKEHMNEGFLPDVPKDWVLLIAIGVLSFTAQGLMTISLRFEGTGMAALLGQAFEFIFAYVIQIVIFKEMPTVYSLCGAGLICLALGISGIRKVIDGNDVKRKLKVLCGGEVEEEKDPEKMPEEMERLKVGDDEKKKMMMMENGHHPHENHLEKAD